MIGWPRFARLSYATGVISYVVVASVVGWLGAAVPLIVRGNTRVWAALKESTELSSGYEGALFLLVVESVVGSFAAWYAVSYGLRFLLPYALRNRFWYGWVVNLTAVLATAAVEPPLFIGFSLLSEPQRFDASLSPRPEQAPHIHQLP